MDVIAVIELVALTPALAFGIYKAKMVRYHPDVILGVAYRPLILMSLSKYVDKLNGNGCFINIKAQFDQAKLCDAGLRVWRR
jgi:hypothetical protein